MQLLPNRQGFSTDLYKRLRPAVLRDDKDNKPVTCANLKEKQNELFPHQKFVSEFINNSPYRGLLLYHGLGSGKTIAAAAAAVAFMRPNLMRVSVWTPASLTTNFKETMGALGVPPNSTKVEFIKYNGLSRAKVDAYDDDYFDGKLVIIDEVHNWISRCVNNTYIAKKMYDKLFFAKNIKILLLTATPMINNPHELAYLLNLVRGPIMVQTLSAIDSTILTGDWSSLDPEARKFVDELEVRDGKIEISLVPNGYVKAGSGGVTKYDTHAKRDDKEIVKSIRLTLEAANKTKIKVKENWYTALPFDKKAFDATFLSPDYTATMNDDLFKRRINGLVSFVKNSNEELYPTLNLDKTQVVKLQMEPTQTQAYVVIRTDEFQKESKAKKFQKFQNARDPFGKTAQVYRAFSRAVCNFAFPSEIKRNYPNQLRNLRKEMDTREEGNDDDEEETVNDEKKTIEQLYVKHLNEIMKKIDKPEYLSKESIKQYSVKFDAVLKKLLATPRELHLLYTQFRSVEGIGLFSQVLRQNGYSEIRIQKGKSKDLYRLEILGDGERRFMAYPADDKRAASIALQIFNSELDKLPENIRKELAALGAETNAHAEICQLLMITQGGAEGITLKNTRQVHILEPYWNKIRHDQVLGRAIRTCSHETLPKGEQNVSAFIYVATLDLKSLKGKDFTVTKNDGGTTDEHIMGITERKAKIMDRFMSLMQSAATDCLFFNKNRERACQVYPLNTQLNHTFMNNIKDDEVDAVTRVRMKRRRWTGRLIEYQGRRLVLNPETNRLFDRHAYVNAGALVEIGEFNVADNRIVLY